MSIFVQALAFLPAAAAIIVALTALADRRDATSLKDLCALDQESESSAGDDLERSAA
jgi:hypothetical protein